MSRLSVSGLRFENGLVCNLGLRLRLRVSKFFMNFSIDFPKP